MKPAAFSYHRPASLDDALALLAEHGEEARPLAGGQSLVPMMNMRVARPEHVVDLNGLADLATIRVAGDTVELGALARHCAVERDASLRRFCPMLPRVAGTIGHYAIRERGTVGGSLALADPAAQWPLLATLFDARIAVASAGGRRVVAARDFFLGVFSTSLEPGELVTGVAFPALAPGEGWGYRAFRRRHGDFAIVAVAATLALDGAGRIERLRLALGGVAGTPLALIDLAAAQRGQRPGDAWRAAVAAAAAAGVEPGADVQASAQFRRELIEVLTAGALADALGRI